MFTRLFAIFILMSVEAMAEVPLPPPRPQPVPLPAPKPEAAPQPEAPSPEEKPFVPLVEKGPVEPCAFAQANPDGIEALPKLEDPKGCVVRAPFSVTLTGGVKLGPAATLNCAMAESLDRFLTEIVQPAAESHLGAPVERIDVSASFVCRWRNSKAGTKPSEHGLANAIDIGAFHAGEHTVTVTDHWRDEEEQGNFLRAVHEGACKHFSTVIGPDGDEHHQDPLPSRPRQVWPGRQMAHLPMSDCPAVIFVR